MSRSSRKQPIRGWSSASSDKPGKVAAHKKYRSYARALTNEDDWDYIAPRNIKENPYDYPKDGKTYWAEKINDRNWMGK